MKRNHGFTLIELLIGITILTVIIAILIAIFAGRADKDKAVAEKLVDRARQIAQAARLYHARMGKWPESIETLVSGGYLKTVPNKNGQWKIAVPDESTIVATTDHVTFCSDTSSVACTDLFNVDSGIWWDTTVDFYDTPAHRVITRSVCKALLGMKNDIPTLSVFVNWLIPNADAFTVAVLYKGTAALFNLTQDVILMNPDDCDSSYAPTTDTLILFYVIQADTVETVF